MKKILLLFCFVSFACLQIIGQVLPFAVQHPGSPEPPKGNMEPIYRSDEYTAKIQLPNGANAQNVLYKATESVTDYLSKTYGFVESDFLDGKLAKNQLTQFLSLMYGNVDKAQNQVSTLSDEEIRQLYRLYVVEDEILPSTLIKDQPGKYYVDEFTLKGKDYVSITFAIPKGADVYNGMMNAVGCKSPNVLLTTISMTVTDDQLEICASDFSGLVITIVDECKNIGYCKGVNPNWPAETEKFIKAKPDPANIPGSNVKKLNFFPIDTLYCWDLREIIASHGPIPSSTTGKLYNPTVTEQFEIYKKGLALAAENKSSFEIIDRAAIAKDIAIKEETLMPIINLSNVTGLSKDSIKEYNNRLDALITNYRLDLGYDAHSWQKAYAKMFCYNFYYDMKAVCDSSVVIGMNLNIFERYFEPVFNEIFIELKNCTGGYINSVHRNNIPQYYYNAKKNVAEPADKKDAKRWAGYKRNNLTL